jgi:hypothetical protein
VDLRSSTSRARAGRNARRARGACTFHRKSLRHCSKVLALSPAEFRKLIEEETGTMGRAWGSNTASPKSTGDQSRPI